MDRWQSIFICNIASQFKCPFKKRNQMDSQPLIMSMVYALCSWCLWNTQDALWSIFSLDPGARKTGVQIRGQFAMSGRGHGSWPVTWCVYSRQHNAHAPPGCLPLNYFSSGSCKWAARRKGLNIDSLCCKFVLEQRRRLFSVSPHKGPCSWKPFDP